MLRHTILLVVALLVFAVFNGLIFQKEKILAQGKTMLLTLAPVDPRSLMQGDYMALRYAMATALETPLSQASSSGTVVVALDDHEVATFRRLYDHQTPLAAGECLLRYKTRKGQIQVGAPSFFFQEGHAEHYENARYGELKVNSAGESILVGLRGAQYETLAPPKAENRGNAH